MSGARRPRTLFRQIYFHGLLLLVLVAVALAFAGAFLGREVQWHGPPVRLAHHVAGLLATLPEAALPAEVERIAEELDVDLAVYSNDGRRLAAVGRRAPPALAPAEAAALHHRPRAVRHRHLLASGAAGPERYVRVASRLSGGELLLRLLGTLALVVAVVAAVSAPVARAISRPIEHLAQVARRLGEGDLQARSGLRRGGEIGALAGALDEMAERLGRVLEAQRELLGNVSHELRTPLARIRVALGLASEGTPEDARRHIQEIEADVAELERLVGDVLTASRLDGGGALVLRRERVDLVALAEEALGRFRRLHSGHRAELHAVDVPAVEGEPALLARVLDNLLDNAAKYSEPDTTVELDVAPGDGGVTVTVRDHGIGIAPEDQARAFTPFFRSDRSRARDTGGVGLGLALSKRIVEAHGGRITLESRLGEGTTLRAWLPAEEAPR
jgi:signal transduction histidine kinase